MKEIIQLQKSEYDELIKSANFNQSEIERLAKEMYEEKGTFGIDLEIDCKQDYTETIKFNAHSCVKDWNGKFPLSEADKRKISNFVNYRALKMMEDKFGRQINDINIWNKRVAFLRSWKIKFIGLTIFGWLAAVSLLITCLFKM